MTYLTNVGSPSAPNNFLRSEVTIFLSSSLQQVNEQISNEMVIKKRKRKDKPTKSDNINGFLGEAIVTPM
jgi:hypothetical protein